MEKKVSDGRITEDSKENIVYYIRGRQLVCRSEAAEPERDAAGDVRWYLYDGHGNVRNLADNSGGLTDSYSYNAYGIRLVKNGDTENMYYYCGEQMDEATGLYYLRARYMNPLTATFTQRDSYEGELESPLAQNRYLYAGGNPVMYLDPSGNTFLEAMAAFSMMDVLRYSMIAVGVYAAAQAGTLMLKAMVSTIEYNGLGNQFVHWFTKITEQETYIPIFVADEAVKRIIIDLIPESKPFFEVMPEYDGERQMVILDPGLVQKVFWEIIFTTQDINSINLQKIIDGLKDADMIYKLNPVTNEMEPYMKQYQLNETYKVLLRKDWGGFNDHDINGDHWNLEIQTTGGRTVYDLHVYLDENGELIPFTDDNIYIPKKSPFRTK